MMHASVHNAPTGALVHFFQPRHFFTVTKRGLVRSALALLPMDYQFFMLCIGGIIAWVSDFVALGSPGIKYFQIEL